MTDEYKVGYKRPPLKSRFQKGKSGNPKGRPKGRLGAKAIRAKIDYYLEKTLNMKMLVNTQHGQRKVSGYEAFALKMVHDALKDPKRISVVLDYFRLREEEAPVEDFPITEIRNVIVYPDGTEYEYDPMSASKLPPLKDE